MAANPELFAIDEFLRQSRKRAEAARLTAEERALRRRAARVRQTERQRLARQRVRDEGLFLADPGYPRGFDCPPGAFQPLYRAWGLAA
jgi:hypothetical protein